jgi:transposase-like protein
MLAAGKHVQEICRALGVSAATYHRWKSHYSSLEDLIPAEFAARCLAPLRPFDSVETACASQGSFINPKH